MKKGVRLLDQRIWQNIISWEHPVPILNLVEPYLYMSDTVILDQPIILRSHDIHELLNILKEVKDPYLSFLIEQPHAIK